MDSKESMLEIQNLHVVYKTDLETVYAVNGLTFSLQKGQTLGLVGETGAGKTTLALTIMGLLPERTGKVTQGAVRFEGEDLIHLSEKNMRHVRGNKIAMIFQDPMTSLNPVLTVGEQIAEALIVHNEAGLTKAEIDARVDETLRMVGIPPARKNEYPHQFSGGMRQRVMIAIALSCEPDLLIADEPTTALDVTIQAQVLLMIRNLRDRLGTSLISLKLLFNGSHKTLTCSFNARMSTIKTDMADLQYRSQSWAFIRPSLLTWSLRPNRFPLRCPNTGPLAGAEITQFYITSRTAGFSAQP